MAKVEMARVKTSVQQGGSSKKWVYVFGGGKAQGTAKMRNLLGGKGANLAEMANLKLPVPPGFTITTDVCTYYYANKKNLPKELDTQIRVALESMGKITKHRFGDSKDPLLLSIRSGGRASMPGMMDTVLNLGLNDKTVVALAKKSNNERFVYDAYRRFIQMYSNVVLGIGMHNFESVLDKLKADKGVNSDTDLNATHLKTLVETYKKIVKHKSKNPFPQDPYTQLKNAIGAVFSSWMNERANVYRRLNNIPAEWGTAVNVQAMVFGNTGDNSATGVAFTRNPSTGEKALYGEFLINAQGEDVVAGIRTPQKLTKKERVAAGAKELSLQEVMPKAFKEFVKISNILEGHYKDMQDMEFTIEEGKLWMLQTRSGKRTAQAALRIAVEMVGEGKMKKEVAITRIEAASLNQLLHPTIDVNAKRKAIVKALPASPGAAVGSVVFNSEDAEKAHKQDKKVILVRLETSPEDITGMNVSQGILTGRGGMTSHAAVVARGMGTPCVSGAGDIYIDYGKRHFKTSNGIVVKEGDFITLDGGTGEVFLGSLPMSEAKLSGDFNKLMVWADKIRRMKVRANAETPQDAKKAVEFGAQGIGLCRTEHMFFEGKRIDVMREMILSETEKGRRVALKKLLSMQTKDFVKLFEIMKGYPVTIRLLDPPLHEFLPHDKFDVVAKKLKVTVQELKKRIDSLHEFNPMLGHRGCRLMISYPEIAEMQTTAIIEAAISVQKKSKIKIVPEIMVPLVGTKKEFDFVKKVIDTVAQNVIKHSRIKINYLVGTMIELPRAALCAKEIAQTADFFSFGTNDLTQMAFGLSRDDAGAFLGDYIEKNILENDPFASIDVNGVGELMKIGCQRGRETDKNIKLGICGEHGGDPQSVKFCETVGLDYVSCSPFRIPIARLAAAQAVIEQKKVRTVIKKTNTRSSKTKTKK